MRPPKHLVGMMFMGSGMEELEFPNKKNYDYLRGVSMRSKTPKTRNSLKMRNKLRTR
jgi:hypothetical protein